MDREFGRQHMGASRRIARRSSGHIREKSGQKGVSTAYTRVLASCSFRVRVQEAAAQRSKRAARAHKRAASVWTAAQRSNVKASTTDTQDGEDDDVDELASSTLIMIMIVIVIIVYCCCYDCDYCFVFVVNNNDLFLKFLFFS